MKRFIEGEDRKQSTLFPECLDDYIAEDNPVRVIDVFVDELDLTRLGFGRIEPKVTGRPACHPSMLLKLYIYAYLNRIQSSRRIEREAQRNVELMWLTERLSPDHKTISDFRKDNSQAIRGVCREFVVLCRRLNLFTQALVVIDGSKFKAVNNRDRNFTKAKMKRRLAQIEASLDRYFAQLERSDREESSIAEDKAVHLHDKIAVLKQEMARLKALEVQMLAAPDQQISLNDPDSRAMKTRGNGIVGYNVQTAVEAEHHLIVAHEVTNQGSDRNQLSPMATQAGEALDAEDLTVIADAGYFKREALLSCHKAGITAFVPRSPNLGNRTKTSFGKRDFHYLPEKDEYRCPANERLIWRMTSEEYGLTLHRYWSVNCQTCALKSQCTTGKERRVTRWEHETILEAMQERLDNDPEIMRVRRQTVEHPYGTLKA
ncbi:MAG TPA: IS1182 family transposase, partial [Gammaproteobacteria bacterium]|nr:IS1182 family transposase [Gammaproteobacteria bacterium]